MLSTNKLMNKTIFHSKLSTALLIILLSILLSILFSNTELSAAGEMEAGSQYSGKEGKITVYISGPAAMVSKLEKLFESEHGDVLELVQMGCGPLRQRVWTEWETGSIQADVFWGSDPIVYQLLDAQGALEPFSPVNSRFVSEEYKTDGNFHYVNERYGVIIYNKDLLAPEEVPTAFNDLGKEHFNNMVIHADPAQSSTALAITAGLWQMNGMQWTLHENLLDNSLILTRKNSDVPSKIQEGEFSAGIAPQDAVFRLIRKAKKEGYPTSLSISWPQEGAIALQRPIAISRNISRPDKNTSIAKNFVNFMLSKEAQKITADFGFVSVRSDVTTKFEIPAQAKIFNVDWDMITQKDRQIRKEFDELF